jgi:reactive intermediate/imine deaminase
VSGQVPAVDGEIIAGGIVEQTHQTMKNLIAILEEAGYGLEDVVRTGVWLDDPRDFWSFNKVFSEYFKSEHAPARACVQASMMVDCKVEIDCVAYKKKA